MRDVAFGQYYPVSSPIHRLDPRLKIIFTIMYIVTMFFVASYAGYALVLIFLLSVCAISHVPPKAMFKSIKGVIVLLEAIDFALKMMFRLILLIMGTTILTFTTGTSELTDAIESLFKPLTLIKIPVRDIALIMSIALRFIPGLIEETDKIMMAQKARGADMDSGNIFKRIKAMLPVIIPVFVSAFRKADELADALDARCYQASPKRTKMKKMRFAWRDLVAFLIFAAFVTLIFLDKYLWGGVDAYIVEAFKGLIG